MIDLTRQNTDVGFAFRLASFLTMLETSNAINNLKLHFPDDFPATVPTFHSPINAASPEYVIAKFPTGTLIMIAGSNQVELGVATLNSYRQNYNGANPANANPYFWNLASTIKSDALSFGCDLTGVVRIIGHSLGGAVAAHLQLMLGVANPENCQTISLNAPRMGDSAICTRIEAMKLVRYFCNDCPVQFVPCHTDEAPLAHTALTFIVANAYNRQTHPRGGIGIASNGAMANAELPFGPLPNTSLSILEWLAFSTTGPGVNHKLVEITQRLRLAADILEPLATRRARAEANEREVTIRPRAPVTAPVETPLAPFEARRIITASREQAHEQAKANQAANTPVRDVSGRFRPRQVSGDWHVVYGDEVVEIAAGKRDAKTRSRRYNRMARQGEEYASVPLAVSEIIAAAFDDV